MVSKCVEAAYLGLGSNLGDRRALLKQAVQSLDDHADIHVIRISRMYESAPAGGPPGQGEYLNAAVAVETSLSPNDLLAVIAGIERSLGRIRTERFAPRTIDIDILLFGDRVCESPELTLPHPRMHERWFVLRPLAEVAADVVHPVFKRSIGEMDRFQPWPHVEPMCES